MRFLALLLLLLASSPAFPVEPYTPSQPDPVLEPWRWRTFPDLMGLGARCMVEDHEGNMWFGVTEGVH